GGSVRLPASWCGLTGLKTTIGRVSTFGILPLSPTLDTPGPMARSVEDAALLYQVMQGPDPLDPRTRGIPPDDPMPMLRRGVRGLRLGRMPEVERAGVDGEVLAAYDAGLAHLERLGAEIVTPDLPCRFGDYTELTGRIIGAEGYFLIGDLIDDMSLTIDEAVRPRIAASRGSEAGIRCGNSRCRCPADPDHANRSSSADCGRSGFDAGAFHPLCQFPRSLRAGTAQRLYRDGVADFVADRLPRLGRSHRLADRVGLSSEDRLARAPAP